jgi:hypothetical protein
MNSITIYIHFLSSPLYLFPSSFFCEFSLAFIGNAKGTWKIITRRHDSLLKKTFNRPNCTNYYNKNLCIIDFVLLYIIINIYIGKTKNSNQY